MRFSTDPNYFSQNDEDQVICKYFGTFVGTLLSIGENNGTDLSNARALIERGWGGHMVEPSEAYKPLCELHKDRSNVHCYRYAISNKNEHVPFYDCADTLLSTINERFAGVQNPNVTQITTEVITFQKFLDISGATHFDFITIDAEGEDWIILQQIDLNALGVKCICVEHDRQFDEIIGYCERFGLKEIHRTFENIILAR